MIDDRNEKEEKSMNEALALHEHLTRIIVSKAMLDERRQNCTSLQYELLEITKLLYTEVDTLKQLNVAATDRLKKIADDIDMSITHHADSNMEVIYSQNNVARELKGVSEKINFL